MRPESPGSRPFGFGLVGVGLIAEFHARAIAEIKDARLVGVVGRDPMKTAAFAQRHAVPFWSCALDELVQRTDIDAVCITTPSGAHLEPALAAARGGKHLVIEKPIEIALERIDRLLAAADAAGVRVAAIFQARFGAGAQRLKAAIEAGRFGRLVTASVYVKWHRDRRYYAGTWHGTRALDGGGALMNQAIHGVDLLQWFAGMPVEVFAITTRCVHTDIEVEDTAVAAVRFASGAVGTIEATTAAYPGWSRRLEITGEHGSACLEDDALVRWDFRTPHLGDEGIRRPNASVLSGAGAAHQINHHGHRAQLQDLIDAVRAGRPLAVDGREGRNAVALVLALYDSSTARRPVTLT